MPQPITYYAQSEAIERLTEKYGPCLEQLTRDQKLHFLAMIADTLSEDVDSDLLLYARTSHPALAGSDWFKDCLWFIASSDGSGLTGLMLALATQLYDNVYAEEGR